MENNGWSKYELHVLRSLERLEKKHDATHEKVEKMHRELAVHKAKSAWEFRILSAIWAALVTSVNAWLGFGK